MKRLSFSAYRILAALLLATTLSTLTLQAKDDGGKKGWSINPLPVLSYETDLGLQYGAMCDIYHYGDGSDFPDYRHKLFLEAAYSTKNSGIFHIFYDSEHLIKGVRVTASASYVPEKIHNFYGYNGFASPYYKEYNRNISENIAYYSIDYKMFRAFADFQGNLASNLKWAFGLTYLNYSIGDVDIKPYSTSTAGSLYRNYIRAGLIRENEASGGDHIEIKGGLVYDTRNHEAAPDNGIWAEALLYGSPDFLGSGYNYIKAAIHFRQYLTIWKDRLVFAYHLAYQGTLAGEAPFYIQQNIPSLFLSRVSSEGLGSSNTLRGINYNRILGDGYVWGNFEMRMRLFSFNLIRQHWYVAINPFFDAGKAVQTYRLEEQKMAAKRMKGIKGFAYPDGSSTLYSGSDESWHFCAGIGGKIAMNYNFILTGELGFALDKRDGNYILALGVNYIF